MSVAEYWNKKYIKKGDIWGWCPSPHLEEVISLFKSKNVRTVLELGSGYGRDLLALAKAGFECTGVEPSKTANKMAEKKFKNEKVSVRLISGDVFSLKNEIFDAVVIVNVLHLLSPEERNILFSGLSGSIKQGGYLSTVFLSVTDTVEYGHGKPVSEHAFEQEDGRTFYFFDKGMACSVLPDDKFNILELEEYHYSEIRKEGPPHNHTMWKLMAQKS